MNPAATRNNPWLVIPRPRPDATARLFCLPYAGAGAFSYRRWSAELPESVEIIAIQLPGREARLSEPPFTRVAPLVRTLSGALIDHLDLPFAIVGHSMGAVVGFELSRELRSEYAKQPQHLIVSGRRAPHLPDEDDPMHTLSNAEFIEELRAMNGTPPELLKNSELMELVLPALRADFELCETHQHVAAEPLGCPITAIGGEADPEIDADDIQAWRDHTRGSFDWHMMPGDHFFHENDSRGAYMAQVRECIAPMLG